MPTYFTLADQQSWCDQTFNDMNPSQPNVTTVDKYGGWNMNPSNVFFSNGECELLMIRPHCGSRFYVLNRRPVDPWRTLSVNSQESNSPQRNGSETVPACNTSPGSPSFFGTTYPGQVHGVDLFAAPDGTQDEMDAYIKGVTLFSSALDQWLQCYHSSGKSNSGWRLSSGKRSHSFRSFFIVQSAELGILIGRSLPVSILLASFLSIILT